MSRVSVYPSQIDVCSWIKTNQEQVQSHPAWHGNIDVERAETLLQGNSPFAYLLRKGAEENAYFITFIKEDQSIKHQRFTLEYDHKGWFYKNGATGSGVTKIIAPVIEELIPQMMHCDIMECKAVQPSKN